MSSIQSVLDTISFAFIAISFPIYFIVVLTLIKYQSQLKSSFFTFFISAGVADLVSTIHKYMTRHAPMMIWGPSLVGNVWLATFHRMGGWSFYFSQIIGVFWLSANRMTALAWPFEHKMIWTPGRIKLAVALQWILPLGFSLPMFHPCCRSTFGSKITASFNNSEVTQIYSMIDIILEPGFFMPSFIVFYSVAFWKARKHSNKVAPTTSSRSQESGENKKAEGSLATSGAVLSGIYIMMCMLIILVQFPIDTSLLVRLFYPLGDLFTMCNPYLLLMFSSKFRPYFKAVIMCRKPHDNDKRSNVRQNK